MRWDLFAILMLLPWAATFGGSVLAARMQSGGPKRQGAMLGFAAGIMIAASIWSLILPAFDNAGKTPVGAAVVSLGFLLGCLGMLLLDKLVPHQHMDEASPEGRPSHMSRPKLLVLAVALHNIPEGMALGVVIAAAMGDAGMSWTAALVFGAGLALQNFPEGMAVVLAAEWCHPEALPAVGLLGQPGRTRRRHHRHSDDHLPGHPGRRGHARPAQRGRRRHDLHRRGGAHSRIPERRSRPRGHLRLSAGLLADGPAGRIR